MKFYMRDNQHFFFYLDRSGEVQKLRISQLEATLQELDGKNTGIKGIFILDSNVPSSKPFFIPPNAEFDFKNLKEICLNLSLSDYEKLAERGFYGVRNGDTSYEIRIVDDTKGMI